METFAFQAEINQLLSLIINAFYTNKDIFLRELISNASDALDKIRYESLTNHDITIGPDDLKISVEVNEDTREIRVSDTGIGMTKDELVKNLGTIAHSGTKAYMQSLQEGKPDVNLIGQFGVGFYSAFLVADSVKVISKSYGPDAKTYVWESKASGTFSVNAADEERDRGTTVILHIKDDMTEYLNIEKLKRIITKHSYFCNFPISIRNNQSLAGITVSDTWEVINTSKPIWMRKPEEVTKEEYHEFFKSIYSGGTETPLAYKHIVVDGNLQFRALFFIPQKPTLDCYGRNTDNARHNVKLYVRHVLILDQTNELLPEYMNFIYGIVDSDDLPLNVSRETLQKSAILGVIKKQLMRHAIELFKEIIAKQDGETVKFFAHYGRSIKTGVYQDPTYRTKLQELLYFPTSERESCTLSQYVDRMKEEQTDIYYMAGDNMTALGSSPVLSKVKNAGYEVFILTDPIDEYCMEAVGVYKDKKIRNCFRDGFKLPKSSDEVAKIETVREEWKDTCAAIKDAIGIMRRVWTVRVGEDLPDDLPMLLISDQASMTANMERIFKAQTISSLFGTSVNNQRILEINYKHPIIKHIKAKVENNDKINDIVEVLYATALMMGGFTVENPTQYAMSVYGMQTKMILDAAPVETICTDAQESV